MRNVASFICATRIRLLISLMILVVLAVPLSAQDYKFTVSATHPWTDTGVDLQAGDVISISATPHNGSSCDPAGVASAGASQNLPVASALPGALIARLQDNGAPTLVGASQQLRVAQVGHLYLGANNDTSPVCQGSFAVKVHISSGANENGTAAAATPAESLVPKANEASKTSNPAPAAGQATSENGEKDVKDIKGALSTAAQTWLSGQFGMGNKPAATTSSSATSGSTTDTAGATGNSATAAPELKISKSPLDSQLRKDIDSLPRRVNDQFQNQGDMVNFVIVGNLSKIQDALTAADWHVADRDVKESVLKAALETYQKKAYLAMPMSELYLFGRVQDYGYEQAEPYAVVASRHHFRIWKAPFQWNGQDVWAGAGTHDIGFEKDQRNGSVTHKIDPAVDGERDNIGATLQKGAKVKTLTYYLPPDPVQDARNATGGGYHSDGRILVIQLQ